MLANARLVTLIGPGGVGKSRLALNVAWKLQDANRVVHWLDSLEHSVAEIGLLKTDYLFVDGCESGGDDLRNALETVLRRDPRMRVLATSRRPLGLIGEVAWRVPGLATEGNEAMMYFGTCAAEVNPNFGVNPRNMKPVRELCDELDRLPLAIELAAAWTGTLSVEQILERVRRDHKLIESPTTRVPADHRSLNSCLGRTWELGSQSAREAWRLLSVFDGDFALEAAQAVAPDRPENALLADLRELNSLSVLHVKDSPFGARYRLFNTAARFGRLRLEASNDALTIRNRHRDWCISLGEYVDNNWRGPRQAELFDRLDVELVNLRQALDWTCSDQRNRQPALRLAGSLCFFWHMRGHVTEGRTWLAKALVGARAITSARAKALTAAGFLAYMNGDVHNGLSLLEKSLALRRRLGDRRTFAFALMSMGILQFYSGEARRARPMLEQSIRLYRALGDRIGTYISLYELAELEAAQGDYEQSLRHHEESLQMKTEQGDRWHIAWSQFGLGLLNWMRGSYETATSYHRQALKTRHELDDWHGIGLSLEGLAWTAASAGQTERAARLLGASEAIWETQEASLPPYFLEHHATSVKAVRETLGEEKFVIALKQGRTMGRSPAVEYALGSATARDASAPRSRAPGVTWLTSRELEIAKLIARGLMNRQIAAVLGIAERTAECHVEHIRDKLDFHSRSQIAAWAVEQGLIGRSEG